MKKVKINFYHRLKPLILAIGFVLLCSHNLYIKMDSYFLKSNQEATLSLYNGTFEKSENIISRDRIIDASIIAQGEITPIDESQWKDKDSTVTQLKFYTGEAGTYVFGVSTKARDIELSAKKFNEYLIHDGVNDILEERKENGTLDEDATESYEKHVKSILQVGETKTDDYKTVLGYPIEFVPQSNPYDKFTGDSLDVQLLYEGKPLANQLVYADYVKVNHNHDHGDHLHDHGNTDHSHDHEDRKHKNDSHDHDHNNKNANHQEHTHSHSDHNHVHKDGEHNYDHDASDKEEGHSHSHKNTVQLRTDSQGIVNVKFPEDGLYYLRTIYMESVDDETLTHQSKWATLTFEITHSHESHSHSHNDHDHEHNEGLPTWIFIVGSLLLIGFLFLIFRKKN